MTTQDTQIPEDIIRAAEAVHIRILGRGTNFTVTAIARAILAERQKCVVRLDDCKKCGGLKLP